MQKGVKDNINGKCKLYYKHITPIKTLFLQFKQEKKKAVDVKNLSFRNRVF